MLVFHLPPLWSEFASSTAVSQPVGWGGEGPVVGGGGFRSTKLDHTDDSVGGKEGFSDARLVYKENQINFALFSIASR